MDAFAVTGFLIGFVMGKELYEIIKLKGGLKKKLVYRISDHMADEVLQSEPPPPIPAEGFMRAIVGASPFALSLVFEFYEDLDNEGTKKFLSKVLLEFIKDLQENKEEFRKLARTKFVVEYTQPLGILEGFAISPSTWTFVDVSRDYIEWLEKTYGIEKDELLNIAVVYHMLKTRGSRVIVRLSSFIDGTVWRPYWRLSLLSCFFRKFWLKIFPEGGVVMEKRLLRPRRYRRWGQDTLAKLMVKHIEKEKQKQKQAQEEVLQWNS
jgi:hypothetical protein